jgi:hypothetical protein
MQYLGAEFFLTSRRIEGTNQPASQQDTANKALWMMYRRKLSYPKLSYPKLSLQALFFDYGNSTFFDYGNSAFGRPGSYKSYTILHDLHEKGEKHMFPQTQFFTLW